MGTEKDRQIKAQDDWQRIAREKGYTCKQCGRTIEKDEYQIFKQTGLCLPCHAALSKG